MHSTICNRLLTDRADKLVYMYFNEKILNVIESVRNMRREIIDKFAIDCLSTGPINLFTCIAMRKFLTLLSVRNMRRKF